MVYVISNGALACIKKVQNYLLFFLPPEVQILSKMLDSAVGKAGCGKSVYLAPSPCGNSGVSEAELLVLQLKMGDGVEFFQLFLSEYNSSKQQMTSR